jgi:hypothetical protein
MPKAPILVQSQRRCLTPGPEEAPEAPKARDTTIKTWWQLSELSSGAAAPCDPDDSPKITTVPDTTIKTSSQPPDENSAVVATPRCHKNGQEDVSVGRSWSRIRTLSSEATGNAWWQLFEESSEVATPRGPEDAAKTTTPLDTFSSSWWQGSEENSGAGSPLGHEGGHEDCAAGHSWSRIRTPSPEYRYAPHGTSASGPPKLSALPLPAQQRHTLYPETPIVPVMAVPPPRQPLLLVNLLEGDQAQSDRAHQHRRDERLGLGGPGGARCLAPADTYAHSIGSMGHPHNCALPCKFSRGGVCARRAQRVTAATSVRGCAQRSATSQ